MQKISNIFTNDINRPIKNVITIGDDEKFIKQELEEYVVTKELNKHFNSFFTAYNKSLIQPVDEIGVWIKGFYGSGKSHLLKILSYILDKNKIIDGKNAVDYFENKMEDKMLFEEMKKARDVSADVILFNIDSVASIASIDQSKKLKEQMLTVFEKKFNEAIGLCSTATCAEFERYLINQNKYEAFQAKYKEINGEDWKSCREREFHRKDKIRKPYAEVMGITEQDAKESLEGIINDYQEHISIDYFTNIVKDYIEKKGNNHHVIFFIDEMGQYIEDDTSLMLNLQTIVEDLGKKCKGKAWVVVTSQEIIDKYTNNKGKDFSKILARFSTRLNLTSSDIEEVIKKRLLEKKNTKEEPYYDKLKELYNENEITIRNLIEFKGGETQKKYTNAQNFADIYPFIPYQFNILQEVFDNIRAYEYTGKSISRGERSLISSTQETARKYINDEIGAIVPFYAFYDSVEKELNTKDSQTMNKSKEKVGVPGGLEEIDIQVLELLFLLKNLKEVPANVENLATLFVSNINDNKDLIKKDIIQSLRRLESQTLIQRNNDVYVYLTDEEQEINKAINGYHVQEEQIREYIKDIIYEENYPTQKYTLNKQIFYIAKFLDEKNYGSNEGKIGIKIYTDDIDVSSQSAINPGYAYIKLDLSLQTRKEIKRALRIHEYRQDKRNNAFESERMTEILARKATEERELKSRLKIEIQNLIKEAPIYVRGTIKDIKSKDIASRFEEALKSLVYDVYSKFNYIKTNYTAENIRDLWNDYGGQVTLNLPSYENMEAYEEVKDYCTLKSNSYNDLSINELVNYFSGVPYGFLENDTEYIIALLVKKEELSLFSNNRTLDNTENETLNKILNKDSQTIIRKREKVEKKKIDVMNNLANQIFREMLPDDEDGMKKSFKQILIDEKDNLKEIYNINYNKHSKYEYPGKEKVSNTIKLFEKIINIDDINDFFDIVFGSQEKIKESMGEINKILNFFNEEQKVIFDKSREIMEYYKESETYINIYEKNDDLEEYINQTDNILRSQEPYDEIPNLNKLCTEIKNILSQIYDFVSEPIIKEVEKTKKEIIEKREKYELNGDEAIESYIENCNKAIHELQSSHRLGVVYAQNSVNQSIREKFEKYLTKILNQKNEENIEENVEKEKKIILTPSMIIKNKEYTIRTSQDIDNYILDIKTTLTEKLNQGGYIIIK